MGNRLECQIVQDLLPLYIDHLTHEYTNDCIKEHLTECQNCKSIVEEMEKLEDRKLLHEVNLLEGKELHRFMNIIKRKNILIGVIIACIIFGSVLLGYKLYFDGQEKGLVGTWTTSQGDMLTFDENQTVRIEGIQCADTLEDGAAFYMVHLNDILRINQGENSIEFVYKISSGKLYLEMGGKEYLTLEKADH